MVAEMLQKYILIFNIFLSKKLYIFLFNQKKFCLVRISSFKENMFIFNQNILLFKKFLYANGVVLV